MITMADLEKSSLDSLTHFGVLGMHWGQHKREDTMAIKKAKRSIANQKQNLNTALNKYNRETRFGSFAPSDKTRKALTVAQLDYGYSKKDLKGTKILERLASKDKSRSQVAMEEKYKQKGMTNDEAAIAAYQNLKTKKVLVIVGGLTLTAAASYAAYKIHDYNVDKVIKSGTVLQNVSSDSTKGIRDAFYSSKNGLDKIKYKGLYGTQLDKTEGNAFVKQIKTLTDIRQASHKNAKATLSELMKTDKDFAEGMKNEIINNNLGPVYLLKTMAAKKSLDVGTVNKSAYEVFNAALVDHSPGMQKLTDKFYGALSAKGYNAVKDINDSKYSGYKALNPIVAFNTKGKVDVISVEKLAKAEIAKSGGIAYAAILGSDLVKKGAIITAGIVGYKTIKTTVTQSKYQKKADEYIKEHPTTNMTNTEIIRMLEKEDA